MTSRERVLCALDHREPDRVPIDFAAWRSSGVHAMAYGRLRRHLGLPDDGSWRLYDVMQQLAEPEEPVRQRFRGDVVQVHRLCPAFGIPIDRWKPGVLADGQACQFPESYEPVRQADGTYRLFAEDGSEIARMPADGGYFEATAFPLAGARTARDIEEADWPLIDATEVAFLRAQAERWRRETDAAILVCFGGNVLEAGNFAFGFERFMSLLGESPELVEAYLERLTQWHLDNLEAFLPAVEGLVDIIAVGDDLGTQEATILSPTMYRRVIKPRQARVYRRIRERSTARLFLHSCGAIEPLLGDLIEIGVEALNPVQITARGMDPAHLKRTYGRDLTLWGGGCDTQVALTTLPLPALREHVKGLVRTFKPGGGFVFTQVHNVLWNVAPERIEAVYDAAWEEGNAA